jgi:hypothetical protein
MTTSKLAALCWQAAAITTIFLTAVYWGQWLIVALVWVFAFPIALLYSFIVGIVGHACGMTVKHEDADEDQLSTVFIADEEFEKSTETVGRFKDKDIHEWVIIDDPRVENTRLKLFFTGTVDIEAGFEPPADVWWAVLPPGLLYAERLEVTGS